MSATDLHIASTEDTPEVHFDHAHSIFRMKGRSLPENAYNFYKPLLEWIKKYVEQNGSSLTKFEFELDYFNSSSGRFIYEMLTLIEENAKSVELYEIRWKTHSDDELMIEKGEELKSLLNLRFNLITL
ncbi:MAG: DUF1987 domain-containing protein [Flavobacteriales bacterium]|jgi:hypothetical protein